MLTLDPIQTVALAAVMLALGYWLTNRVALLRDNNIPAPIVGGLIIALLQWATYKASHRDWADVPEKLFVLSMKSESTHGLNIPFAEPFTNRTLYSVRTATEADRTMSLTEPFMQMFFASLGFGASLGLIRIGGPQVVRFFLLAVAFAVIQNLVGMLAAWLCGRPLLFGVMCGSVTLTGGPATGIAFAKQFEERGIANAAGLALASGMGGIIFGGFMGGPLGKWLVEGNRLRSVTGRKTVVDRTPTAEDLVEKQLDPLPEPFEEERDEWSTDGLLKAFVALLVAMGVGVWLSPWISALGASVLRIEKFTLPSFIGAMFVAVFLRNLDDRTRWFRFSQRLIDDFGNLALGVFITLTLMDLKLWELASDASAALHRTGRAGGRVVSVLSDGRVSRDGARLRSGGDERRLLRLHDGNHGQLDGRHADDGRKIRPRPARRSWSSRSSARF
ncbi:MAG: sodium/glutamate symporter [Pirellulales bacterium]